jgi:hypothetical protein
LAITAGPEHKSPQTLCDIRVDAQVARAVASIGQELSFTCEVTNSHGVGTLKSSDLIDNRITLSHELKNLMIHIINHCPKDGQWSRLASVIF